ncbi:DUF1127 domain-containing protein [Azospirillum halopraeferens]|uniref:DUF1127 domain-containing protein n=1 Tax=Azospirillum halopraeferens TaxID=34010 RepID=UPI00054DADC1|nr:DUF1127 domain-containing protein [Azospirillum halopraeferens]
MKQPASKRVAAGGGRRPMAAPAIAALVRWLSRPAMVVEQWRRRSRERRELDALDDVMLRDIGLTRCDITHEVRKPFWHP